MKKIFTIISIVLCVMITSVLSGCTVRTNYIRKYHDELHTIFGDFEYEYTGTKYNVGYDGIGAHDYKVWNIYFTDAYGIKKQVTLTNDTSFDDQIRDIFEQVVERNLISQILSDYFNRKFIDENVINIYDSNSYYTKAYDYVVHSSNSFRIDFNYEDAYNESKYKITDYSFFNLSDTTIEELIENGTIKIKYIIYHPQNEQVLSDEDREEQINYLTILTQEMDEIISVESAYYHLNEYCTNADGKTYVSQSNQYTLELK